MPPNLMVTVSNWLPLFSMLKYTCIWSLLLTRCKYIEFILVCQCLSREICYCRFKNQFLSTPLQTYSSDNRRKLLVIQRKPTEIIFSVCKPLQQPASERLVYSALSPCQNNISALLNIQWAYLLTVYSIHQHLISDQPGSVQIPVVCFSIFTKSRLEIQTVIYFVINWQLVLMIPGKISHHYFGLF